ncbi:hypothetical protein MP228_006583 [Amoeboaphelidium protococcarum]|nr:hypothetical protein MP228_006583 [Amoeboaphelidium protococcarum]
MEAVLAAREHDYANLGNTNGYYGYGQWDVQMMRAVFLDTESESDRSGSPVAQRQSRQQWSNDRPASNFSRWQPSNLGQGSSSQRQAATPSRSPLQQQDDVLARLEAAERAEQEERDSIYAERERLERIEEIEDRLRERDEIICQQRLEDGESVSNHIWHYPDEWAPEQGIRQYGMHHDKYEIMMHDYDLGDLTTYEVEELQRKAVEVLRQMVSVGRSMEQMGGFIVAANCVDEYIHDCYYPRQMAEEYKVFAAEKEAYLATVLPLDVDNGDRLPSPLPWRLPSPFPTLTEIREYMEECNIEYADWYTDHP